MMSKKTVCPLYSAADREKAQTILDALCAKGFRIAEKAPAVLVFLSENFAADEAAQERFFTADSAGRAIIPVDLDGAVQNELVRSALIAKNAVSASGRTPEEIAERVSSAQGFLPPRPRIGLIRLLAAAALLLALGAILWLWRSAPQRAQARERAALLSEAQLRYGLSEEDLAGIAYVYIVSDGFYPLREDEGEKTYTIFPNYNMEADGMHWTSHEDGHRIYAASWEKGDWDVLKLMPNLEGLVIVLADAGTLPDLSGLEHLDWMQIIDSRITDIGGLSGSSLTYFGNFRCPVGDYSPLTRCEKLEEMVTEFDFLERADLSTFSPPALRYARFGYAPAALELDLSGLKNCTALEEVKIDNIPCGPPDGERSPVTGLDFLAGLPNLKTLTLENMTYLRDVSALGTLPALEELTIKDCGRVTDISALAGASALRCLKIENDHPIRDFSPLGACRALQEVSIDSDKLFDTSFLSDLPALNSAHLNNSAHGAALQDVDFLLTLAPGTAPAVTLNAAVDDYSGLAGPEGYGYLCLGPDEEVLDRALPYLQGKTIDSLAVMRVKPSDWALMPEKIDSLWVLNTDLTDLKGLAAWKLEKIQISTSRRLRSLDGIGALRGLDAGTLCVEINECPMLYDLSALEGTFLDELQIRDTLELPPLPELRVKRLRLQNITELSDLRCLDSLDASESVDIELVGLDGLRDLTPLRRFHGESLIVPPQLAEQGQELVESGSFQSCDVFYPEEGWYFHDDEEISLLSLDELDTLSKTLLGHVRELCLVGDRVVDTERFELAEHGGTVVLRDRGSGEETELAPQGGLSELSALSTLTGLQRLTLLNQPLESLEGIQRLDALESLDVRNCAALTELSAAFKMQGLHRLTVMGCPLRSLDGVQHLTELEELCLSHTGVNDLRPLLELPALRSVRLSGETAGALDSLAGVEYGFELIVE